MAYEASFGVTSYQLREELFGKQKTKNNQTTNYLWMSFTDMAGQYLQMFKELEYMEDVLEEGKILFFVEA